MSDSAAPAAVEAVKLGSGVLMSEWDTALAEDGDRWRPARGDGDSEKGVWNNAILSPITQGEPSDRVLRPKRFS